MENEAGDPDLQPFVCFLFTLRTEPILAATRFLEFNHVLMTSVAIEIDGVISVDVDLFLRLLR